MKSRHIFDPSCFNKHIFLSDNHATSQFPLCFRTVRLTFTLDLYEQSFKLHSTEVTENQTPIYLSLKAVYIYSMIPRQRYTILVPRSDTMGESRLHLKWSLIACWLRYHIC